MISFCVTTKNEGLYLDGLLTQLVTMLDKNNGEDEIVIIDDYSDDEETLDILSSWRNNWPVLEFYQRHLQKDFGAHKNFGIEKCSKHWIFQIDADETLAHALEDNVHSLLLDNSETELFLVPRVNIVNGITQEDIKKWGWVQNEKDGICGQISKPEFFKIQNILNGKVRFMNELLDIKHGHTFPKKNNGHSIILKM